MDVEGFVAGRLPFEGCRVLEVGCGDGELARALVRRGYAVTAIDPVAPEGPPFERVTLEEYAATDRFDAVVAARSLHHVHDLPGAVEKIHSLLKDTGVLVLDEFAWEQMDARTRAWYVANLAGAPAGDDSLAAADWARRWAADHEGLHESGPMRAAFAGLFDELLFERTPYVAANYLERPDLVAEEARLIDAGEIAGVGWRYVAVRK